VRRFARRQLLWTALFAIAVGVLVLLLVLIGVGYLRLPSAPAPTMTVSEVKWTVLQGTNSYGEAWFGRGVFNYTPATGWQTNYAAGSTFTVNWDITNYDNVDHTIYTVTVNAPFLIQKTGVPLPMNVMVGDEGNPLLLYVTTSGSQSGTFTLDITVNALGPG
jgi:hypothetical protein